MPRFPLPVATSRQPVVRDHISYSSISLFQSCSLRYFFKYVEHLPEASIAASLLEQKGFPCVQEVSGGITAWEAARLAVRAAHA